MPRHQERFRLEAFEYQLTSVRDFERRALQLPKLSDVIQELELDPGLGGQFVETLDAGYEFEGVDVDGERGRPVIRWNHLADAVFLGDRLDLSHVLQRLLKLLRGRAEDGAFGRRREVELVQLFHAQRHVGIGGVWPETLVLTGCGVTSG